ncbi:hypothetical protein Q1695_005532 [Nippostrongylus brasiliensis]|nr:hypothetical protein Q1695_005532 [Nippostrongylus brasiliensis]
MHHSRNRVRIGGPGVTVQLDKTLLTRRKCNRGRVVRSHQWLFGGIGVGCGRAFLNLDELRQPDYGRSHAEHRELLAETEDDVEETMRIQQQAMCLYEFLRRRGFRDQEGLFFKFWDTELIGGQLWECIVNMREVKQLQSECVQLPKSSDAVVTRLMEFVNKQTHTIVGMAAMVSR